MVTRVLADKPCDDGFITIARSSNGHLKVFIDHTLTPIRINLIVNIFFRCLLSINSKRTRCYFHLWTLNKCVFVQEIRKVDSQNPGITYDSIIRKDRVKLHLLQVSYHYGSFRMYTRYDWTSTNRYGIRIPRQN